MRGVLRLTVDGVMTVLLLLLMAFTLTGQEAHEWLGTAALLLFVLHHLLNIRWLKTLGRGRWTALRIFRTALVLAVLLTVLGAMVSGIWMSRYAFSFLPRRGGMALSRKVHMLCVYWGFLFLSAHLGVHWGGMLGAVKKAAGDKIPPKPLALLLRAAAAALSGYGVYAFRKHRTADYLFLKSEFVFFDLTQPPAQFLAEYAAMMALWAAAAYYLGRFLQRRKKREEAA